MTTEPDPSQRRVPPLGRRLRAHGLDELPQLFNVLKGDEPRGPAPPVPTGLRRLGRAHPAIAERVEVPPGSRASRRSVRRAAPAERPARSAVSALVACLARPRDPARTAWINVVGKERGQWLPQRAEARLARP